MLKIKFKKHARALLVDRPSNETLYLSLHKINKKGESIFEMAGGNIKEKDTSIKTFFKENYEESGLSTHLVSEPYNKKFIRVINGDLVFFNVDYYVGHCDSHKHLKPKEGEPFDAYAWDEYDKYIKTLTHKEQKNVSAFLINKYNLNDI